jgi:hypothetical protein
MTDFCALCAELQEAVQLYAGLDPAAADTPVNQRVARLMDAMANTTAALAQPEPQGPPKNCWLDDEPYLCPSPCVFDDPSEVIDNCVEARYLSEKGKPKEACKYYRTTAQPEPQGPTDRELWDLYQDLGRDFSPTEFARTVLTRWGRAAIEPVPVAERLPGPEELDDQGTCWMFHPVNLHYCLCRPDPSVHTHWLPHWALPVPAPDNTINQNNY